jgi:hypothetical protein
MVERGLGVALVHDWAPPWPEGLSLLKIPVLDNQFGRRLGLIWSPASGHIRFVQAFLEVAIVALAARSATTPKPKGSLPPQAIKIIVSSGVNSSCSGGVRVRSAHPPRAATKMG